MKAKLYLFDDKMEMRFEDETIYIPTKGESKEDFVTRCTKIATDDYLEDTLDVVEIDKEKVATNDDEALTEAFRTSTGLQKALIEAVLGERGLIKMKAPREKVEKKSADEMKATQHYLDCEANIGKYAKFSPHKSEEVYEGKIAGIALNKTNTIVYYTIVEAAGKRRCCAAKNESLEFIEAPKQEAAKETAKASKADKVEKAATTKKSSTSSKKNATEAASDDSDEDLS